MTFPTVEATNTSATAVAATSHSLALPASIQAGDLLLAFMGSINATGGLTPPAGWLELVDNQELYLAVRQADGSEGASATFTSAASVTTGHNSYRISGHSFNIEGAILIDSFDPPNAAPTWAPADTLWLAGVIGFATTAFDVTVAPANYTDLIKCDQTSYSAGVFRCASARRQLAAASEDPGAFTVTGTAAAVPWWAWTLGVRPFGGMVGVGLTRSARLRPRSLVS